MEYGGEGGGGGGGGGARRTAARHGDRRLHDYSQLVLKNGAACFNGPHHDDAIVVARDASLAIR